MAAAHPASRELDVELDHGAVIRVGADYLEAGELHHAYAITAHRAQGATVDRTFVLGSSELYRGWGYTAMSRHRQEARFYVAGGELKPEPDLPPHADQLVRSVARLMMRSEAKGLAIDELPAADREQLERERRLMRESFDDDPPPRRDARREREQREALEEQITRVRADEQRLLQRHKELRGWRARHARTGIEQQLDGNQERLERLGIQLGDSLRAGLQADLGDEKWLAAHGRDARRFLAVDEAVRRQYAARDHVAKQLDAHHRDPLPQRDFDLDLGLDL